MIDDNNLIQAAGTVLAGALIFLTLEKSFEQKTEYQRQLDRLLDKRNTAFKERENLQGQLDRLKILWEAANPPSPDEDPIAYENFEKEKNPLVNQIRHKDIEIKNLSNDKYSLTRHYQYTNLKTGEGKITFIMIMLLTGSIILMLFTGVPYLRPIAIIIFIAGLVLLVWRVHKHGKGSD